MSVKYSLDPSLRKLYLVPSPLIRALFPLSNRFLGLFLPGSDSTLEVKKHHISGLSVLEIAPRDAAEDIPCVICLHGGAFVYRAAPYHYSLMKEYAKWGLRILMPDYSLSPRSLYPGAVEETVSLYGYLCNRFSSPPSFIGDSAGGEIAISSTMRIIRRGMKRPAFLSLVYPVVAPLDTPSRRRFSDTPVWNSRLNRRMWDLYLGGGEYESVFDCTFLSSFPPVYIETPLLDPLHDEAVMLAGKLEKSGVAVVRRDIDKACHGYDMILSSPLVKESLQARKNFIMNALC